MRSTGTSASDVAKYLICLAGADENSEYLNPLRLQKLLYYAQGWSLVVRSRPMFYENIEAWSYGPVVPAVYREYKDYGRREILLDDVGPDSLTDEEREFLQRVWATYKDYSGVRLANMTHNEPPWKDARGNLPPDAASSRVIPRKAMERYFSKISDD